MFKQIVVALILFEAIFVAIVMFSGYSPDVITTIANLAFAGWLAMEAGRVRLGHGSGESTTFGLLSRMFLVASFAAVVIAFGDRATGFSLIADNRILTIYFSAIGTAFFTVGVLLRHLSISALGKFFVTKVQITNDHQLIKEGIYQYLRHPSYTGLIFGFVGIAAMLQSLSALIFFVVVALPAYMYRIRVEESALLTTFGTEYSNYRKETYAVIPYIY